MRSWSLTGVVFRGAFAGIAPRDTYYNSETEGHNPEKEKTAFAKAFFFERAVAENIHEAVTSDEENAWKKGFNIAKSIAPVLAMGGIQGGKKVGNEILDATQSDVIAAAKETVPAKIAEQIKKGIDAAKEYRSQLRNQSKGTGAEEKATFIGKLKGEDVTLKDIELKELEYTKRPRTEYNELRDEFRKNVQSDFLKELGKDVKSLKEAGFSDVDILKIQAGKAPKGWQVHHKIPLDDGGTNDFSNLSLVKNDPYHKVFTNTQTTNTRGMQVGDTKIIDNWPVPEGKIYPEKP